MFLIGCATSAQDTTFIRSLPLDSTVYNIDSDGEHLYLRFKNSFYSWKRDELDFVQEGKFKYSWLNFDSKRNVKVITHNDGIEVNQINAAKKLGNLIPGESNLTTTALPLGDYLYVCHNGKVLEYKITPGFTRVHRGNSIRHIYSEPGFRVISTYNGIFMDTVFNQFSTFKMDEKIAGYSNGEFVKIDSAYYLCQDNLISFNPVSKDLQTHLNTEGNPRFRKLLKFDNKVFALYNSAFGEVNLKTGSQDYLIKDDLSDFIEFRDKLYISSFNSILYEMDREGAISRHDLKAPINDLEVIGDELWIGTNAGLFTLKDGAFFKKILNIEILQVVSIDDKVVYTNNSGLYCYFGGEITPLIENIEFNRMALNRDEHYLYAGSVNGLYVIENNLLAGLIQTPPQILKESNYFTAVIIGLLVLFITSVLFAVNRRKQRNKNDFLVKRKTMDSKYIRNVVINNPRILSVGQLAEHLDTSVVQLNRHLKKEGLTGLKVLKSIMKGIAIEMYENGSSLDEISKRVGYSKRYVKSKFLTAQRNDKKIPPN